MAEAKTSSKQSGLTRGKAIVIAVLAVALVVILYVQFGMSSEKTNSVGYHPPRQPASPTPTDSAAKPAAGTTAKKPTGKEIVSTPIIDETRWKSPELATVTAYDPFALPPSFPQPPRVIGGSKADKAEGLIAAAAADDAKRLADAVEKLHMELEELTQRGVHVIVQERDGYAAMIGDRTVRVGDKINEFTVTAIDPDGVHVERKQSP